MPEDGSPPARVVHTQRFGQGPEQALMLHCMLAHSGIWAPLASRLAGRLEMIAPDMPGHGRSDDWDGSGDYHDSVCQSANRLLVPGMHLIGHSFGATVALRLAQLRGTDLRSLTLIEPVLFAAAKQTAPAEFAAYQTRSSAFRAACDADDPAAAARLFAARWGDGRAWDALPLRQRAGFAARIGIVSLTGAALEEDAAGLLTPGALESVTAPVLLVRGTLSEPIIPFIHDALAARLRTVRQIAVPGAGHMLPLTHPEPLAQEILGVLDHSASGHG